LSNRLLRGAPVVDFEVLRIQARRPLFFSSAGCRLVDGVLGLRHAKRSKVRSLQESQDGLEGQLIGDRWTIATGDDGLTKKAAELRVLTCTPDEFIALTENATEDWGC
jgi:hypothetical protein